MNSISPTKFRMASAYIEKLALEEPERCDDCDSELCADLTARGEVDQYCGECLGAYLPYETQRFNELLRQLYG